MTELFYHDDAYNNDNNKLFSGLTIQPVPTAHMVQDALTTANGSSLPYGWCFLRFHHSLFLFFFFLLAFLLAFSFGFFFFFFSKEFYSTHLPISTSSPIHMVWSPRAWFLPGTFELRRFCQPPWFASAGFYHEFQCQCSTPCWTPVRHDALGL